MMQQSYAENNPWEERLASAFHDMHIQYLRYYCVCLQCGSYFHIGKGNYKPASCPYCRFTFSEPNQWTVPDFIIKTYESLAKHALNDVAVYVDGKPHTKTSQKRKDLIKRVTLKSLGYNVCVIKNDLVDNCQVTWMRVIASGIAYMARNPRYYQETTQGEKELVGMGERTSV